MEKYDICIIGCGPCSLISALELSKNFNVCIIEAGRKFEDRKCPLDITGKCFENCDPCNIITGYGGCQFIDGTKACFYPAGSGLLKFADKEEIVNYYNYVENILNSFGKPIRQNENSKKIQRITKKFNKQSIDLKYYNAQKIDKKIMKLIGQNIRKELIENNVHFYFNEFVKDIQKNSIFTIITDNMQLQSKKIILATGRYGGLFLNGLSKKLEIDYDNNNFEGELGIRIEMPYNIFNKINGLFNDIKIKKRIDDNNEIRTFCQNYKGTIRKCVFDTNVGKITSLDGCILGSYYNTKSVNIAIHHRRNNIKNFEKFIKMIIKINIDNKPIAQNMKSFLNNNKEYEIKNKYCTMTDYSLGNINDYLPNDTLNYIKKMIIDIDKVIPGFAADENIVYAPSFELIIDKYKLSKSFETNVKGLYIGEDASGYFRGLMQAMISGKIISEDIKKAEVEFDEKK